MQLEQSKQGAWMQLKAEGRLDGQHAGALDEELEALIRGGEHQIRVHMAAVSYMSSAGIRVLVKYAQQLRKLGGGFRVVEPSSMVQSVLDMTGLAGMLMAAEEEPAVRESVRDDGAARVFGPMTCHVHRLEEGASLTAAAVGAPRLGERHGEEHIHGLSLPVGTLAVGVGALGEGYADCKERFGEFLAAGGAAAYMPADGSNAPDYMRTQGALVPEVQALYALHAEGAMAACVRFETDGDAPGVRLSQLAQAALEISGASAAGFVVVAETAGLVGAALKQSPAALDAPSDFFAHPDVRHHLRFAPERIHDRSLVLAVGFAAQPDAAGALADQVRPLGEHTEALGHVHAAAFSYRALPKGPIDLDETVAVLFEEQAIEGILHLLHDDRDITGGGESLFVRGALWISPVTATRKGA